MYFAIKYPLSKTSNHKRKNNNERSFIFLEINFKQQIYIYHNFILHYQSNNLLIVLSYVVNNDKTW
jgi:hypothetical protein